MSSNFHRLLCPKPSKTNARPNSSASPTNTSRTSQYECGLAPLLSSSFVRCAERIGSVIGKKVGDGEVELGGLGVEVEGVLEPSLAGIAEPEGHSHACCGGGFRVAICDEGVVFCKPLWGEARGRLGLFIWIN